MKCALGVGGEQVHVGVQEMENGGDVEEGQDKERQ